MQPEPESNLVDQLKGRLDRIEAALAALLERLGPAAPSPTACLRIPQVAEQLCVCRGEVYRIIRTGRLRSVKVGSQQRVRHVDLIAYLQRAAKKG